MGLLAWGKKAGERLYNAGAAVANVVAHPVESVKKAAAAVESAREWAVEKTSVGMVYVGKGAEWISKGENWKKIGNGLADYGDFLREDPMGALAAAGRGGVNALWATGGLAADVVVFAAKTSIKLNPFVNLYNLGAAEEDQVTLKSWPAFGECTSGLTNWGNDILANKMKMDWAVPANAFLYERDSNGDYVRGPGGKPVLAIKRGPDGKPILDENGMEQYIKDKHYMYKAITEQAAQALVEIPAFVAATALTGGAAGAAIAVSKGALMATQKAMSGYRLGRAAISISSRATQISTYGLSKPIAKLATKVPANPLTAFTSGAKAGGKFMSPIQKQSWLSAHYAEKSASLSQKGARFRAMYEGTQPIGRMTKVNNLFNQNALLTRSDKAFDKAQKVGKWADNYDEAIKANAAKGKGPGWTTTPKEWLPEAGGFALVTTIGIKNKADERKATEHADQSGKQAVINNYNEELETDIRDELEAMKAGGFTSPQDIADFVEGIKEYQRSGDKINPDFLQEIADEIGIDPAVFESQSSADPNVSPAFVDSAAPHPAQRPGPTSLTDAANFAFAHYSFKQQMNGYSAGFTNYRMSDYQPTITFTGLDAA